MASGPDAGAWVRFCYMERDPLARVWGGLSDAGRCRALDYWIARAERDPWVFRELLVLSAAMEDAGKDKPPRLRAFMVAYLRGESAPPKGWKSDPTRDARIAALLHIGKQLGVDYQAGYRMIGKALGKNAEAVRKARKRGETW